MYIYIYIYIYKSIVVYIYIYIHTYIYVGGRPCIRVAEPAGRLMRRRMRQKNGVVLNKQAYTNYSNNNGRLMRCRTILIYITIRHYIYQLFVIYYLLLLALGWWGAEWYNLLHYIYYVTFTILQFLYYIYYITFAIWGAEWYNLLYQRHINGVVSTHTHIIFLALEG